MHSRSLPQSSPLPSLPSILLLLLFSLSLFLPVVPLSFPPSCPVGPSADRPGNLDKSESEKQGDADDARLCLSPLLPCSTVAVTAPCPIPASPSSSSSSSSSSSARRTTIFSLLPLPFFSLLSPRSPSYALPPPPLPAFSRLVLPLTWQPTLSAYTVNYSIDGSRFAAVVDTGSPFLSVKANCARTWSSATPQFDFGCWKGEGEIDPLLSDTVEQFGSLAGDVYWRRGDLSLGSRRFPRVAFGAVGAKLLSSNNGGAVFFGLVKGVVAGIRPALLAEIGGGRFRLDLPGSALTIFAEGADGERPSSKPLRFADLRKYGSPVRHYAARVKFLLLDGTSVRLDRPTYAILDTGCTGLLISQSMYARGIVTRTPRSAVVGFENGLELVAGGRGKRGGGEGRPENVPFLALPVAIPWFGERGLRRPETAPIHVMSLGLAFFGGRTIDIDADSQEGWVT